MRVEPVGTAAPEPSKIRQAAEQFEGLLLGQLLKSVREDSEDDPAGAAMLDVAQEHLGQLLASQGGLGLANLVVKGLNSFDK